MGIPSMNHSSLVLEQTKQMELSRGRAEKPRPEKDFSIIQGCKAIKMEKSEQAKKKFWIDKHYWEAAIHHAEQRIAQLEEAGIDNPKK